MMMYMYSVEDKNGKPRSMFSSLDEAKADRQPSEFVVEYSFRLEDCKTVVCAYTLDLDGGEE